MIWTSSGDNLAVSGEFLIVRSEENYGYLVVEVRDTAKTYQAQDSPHNKEFVKPQISMAPQLKNPGLNPWFYKLMPTTIKSWALSVLASQPSTNNNHHLNQTPWLQSSYTLTLIVANHFEAFLDSCPQPSPCTNSSHQTV